MLAGDTSPKSKCRFSNLCGNEAMRHFGSKASALFRNFTIYESFNDKFLRSARFKYSYKRNIYVLNLKLEAKILCF